MLKEITDFVFPKISIISGNRLPGNNSNQYLSDFELSHLERVSKSDLADLSNKIISDHSFSLFAFREGDDFSKIIHCLKYSDMKMLGIFLGKYFADELKKFIDTASVNDFDILTSVPLHKTKLRERGYNQSEFLCKGINERLAKDFIPDLLERVRHTSSQTKLSRTERMENMKDAFIVNENFKEMIQGKKIIVVDDVITTGSTINEIVKALKVNHCGEILACSLAMAR